MKKVSVQFNLVVDDNVTHKQIKKIIQDAMQWQEQIYTSIQINDIQKKG